MSATHRKGLKRWAWAAALLLAGAPHAGAAQALVDTLFGWQGYAAPSSAHLRIYKAPRAEARTHTIVIGEAAGNAGATAASEAQHLAELVGRAYHIDPAAAYWVFHWGAFSFPGAAPSRKELFLRATFRRSESGSLSSPTWRLLSRREVEDLTDRRFR